MTTPIKSTLKSAPEHTQTPIDRLGLEGLKEVANLVSENSKLNIAVAVKDCRIRSLETQMKMRGIKPI